MRGGSTLAPTTVMLIAWIAWAVSFGVALYLVAQWIFVPTSFHQGDWDVLTDAGARVMAGHDPYGSAIGRASFRWSPLTAYVFGVIDPVGPLAWAASWALVVVVADRLVGLFLLLSLPFWVDVISGLTFLPIVAAGIYAVRGAFAGGLAWIALTVLVPRPLMLPILAWLLLSQPRLRLPAMAILALGVVGAWATGWGEEWLGTLVRIAVGGDPVSLPFAPVTLLGPLWLPIAVVMAAVLGYKGHLGLASLTMSPYWLPAYFQIVFLELVGRSSSSADSRAVVRPHAASE